MVRQIWIFIPLSLGFASELSVLKDSTKSFQVVAYKGEQSFKAEAREIRVSTQSANSGGHVLMVFDPSAGSYWWRYQTSRSPLMDESSTNFLKNYRLYFSSGQAVGFTYSRPFLWIREVRGEAKNLWKYKP